MIREGPWRPEALPRRIVLSRKGSDAAWGGRPSLRLGTELVSLPIPESAARSAAARSAGVGTRFGDLPSHGRLGPLHNHLRGIGPGDYVHLDPDLRPELRPAHLAGDARHERLFGQEGAAEGHLRNQHVGAGDLFLFFGWFREVVLCDDGRPKRVGPDVHCLWGWLQIGATYPVSSADASRALPWAAHHPHVAHWDRYDRHNRLYRARRRLSFAPHLPGAGVFRWHPALTLTQGCTEAPATRRAWCVPSFFGRTGLTYNEVGGPACPSRKGHVHLYSAPIGQEFVAPADRRFRAGERGALLGWLASLFLDPMGA